MLWFPQIKEAVLMETNSPTGEYKWWVGALNNDMLITAWSKHPETPEVEAQSKILQRTNINPSRDRLQEMCREKLLKGYGRKIKWEGGMWQIPETNPPTNLPAFIPDTLALTDPQKGQLIGRVILTRKPIARILETVRLEIFASSGMFAWSDFCRLDHYEYGRGGEKEHPVWQTVYSNPTAAMGAVDTMIIKRLKLGYTVEERDVSKVNPTNFMPIPLIRPDCASIVWDF